MPVSSLPSWPDWYCRKSYEWRSPRGVGCAWRARSFASTSAWPPLPGTWIFTFCIMTRRTFAEQCMAPRGAFFGAALRRSNTLGPLLPAGCRGRFGLAAEESPPAGAAPEPMSACSTAALVALAALPPATAAGRTAVSWSGRRAFWGGVGGTLLRSRNKECTLALSCCTCGGADENEGASPCRTRTGPHAPWARQARCGHPPLWCGHPPDAVGALGLSRGAGGAAHVRQALHARHGRRLGHVVWRPGVAHAALGRGVLLEGLEAR